MSASTTDSPQTVTAGLNAFQQRALALAADQCVAAESVPLLATLRANGAQEFERATWPGRKTEHWKYTSVHALQSCDALAWAEHATVSGDFVAASLIPMHATRLVFVDGIFNAAASDLMPDGVSLFSQADEQAAQVIASSLGSVAGSVAASRRNLFAALNSAWTDEGLLVHVARNAVLEKPLYLAYVSSSANNVAANLRTLIVLEQGASAQVVEHFLSDIADDSEGVASSFVNTLTEIQIGNNARLQHTRLNLEHESASHVGAVHVNLMRDAVLNGFTLAQGSKLKRLDYQLNHCGQGATLNFDGVYLARHQQQVDYHTCLEHRVPNCTSQQTFRGIVGDKAKAVFNGRIHIFEDAQKTLAEMSNRNLLTSNSAEINTKPELEIYADDVKCAHGATISQLDETALYYLQSRGINPSRARMMLSFGFINELLASLPDETLRTWLEDQLHNRFSEDRSFVSDVTPQVLA